MDILFYILSAVLGAVVALGTYIFVRKILLKGQKDEIIKKAELEAESIKKTLQGKVVHLQAKGGEGGRLFGAVTNMDIAAAVKKQFDIEIDKKKIRIPEPIKTVGTHEAEIRLFTEVTASVKVDVTIG